MRTGDGLTGVVLAALGIVVFWYANGFPNTSGTYYGPAFVPQIIGVGLVICGTILVIRAIRVSATGSFYVRIAHPFDQARAIPSVALVLVSIFAFVFVGEPVGFQIITFATLLTAFLWQRGGIAFCLTLALAVTAAFDIVFRVMLKVPVPSGPLTGLI